MSKLVRLEGQGGPMWVHTEHIMHIGVPVDKQGVVVIGHCIVTMPMGQYVVSETPEEVAAKLNGEDPPEKKSPIRLVN